MKGLKPALILVAAARIESVHSAAVPTSSATPTNPASTSSEVPIDAVTTSLGPLTGPLTTSSADSVTWYQIPPERNAELFSAMHMEWLWSLLGLNPPTTSTQASIEVPVVTVTITSYADETTVAAITASLSSLDLTATSTTASTTDASTTAISTSYDEPSSQTLLTVIRKDGVAPSPRHPLSNRTITIVGKSSTQTLVTGDPLHQATPLANRDHQVAEWSPKTDYRCHFNPSSDVISHYTCQYLATEKRPFSPLDELKHCKAFALGLLGKSACSFPHDWVPTTLPSSELESLARRDVAKMVNGTFSKQTDTAVDKAGAQKRQIVCIEIRNGQCLQAQLGKGCHYTNGLYTHWIPMPKYPADPGDNQRRDLHTVRSAMKADLPLAFEIVDPETNTTPVVTSEDEEMFKIMREMAERIVDEVYAGQSSDAQSSKTEASWSIIADLYPYAFSVTNKTISGRVTLVTEPVSNLPSLPVPFPTETIADPAAVQTIHVPIPVPYILPTATPAQLEHIVIPFTTDAHGKTKPFMSGPPRRTPTPDSETAQTTAPAALTVTLVARNFLSTKAEEATPFRIPSGFLKKPIAQQTQH